MHWFLDPITKHYADFNGRATRQEYWMFVLMSLVFFVVVGIGSAVLATLLLTTSLGSSFLIMPGLFLLCVLGLFLPGTSLQVRRLHDIGMSGAWWFISLVPFGGLVLFIFMCLPSKPGTNQYGSNKYEPTSDTIATPPVPPMPTAFTPYVPPTSRENTPAAPTQELSPQGDKVAPVVGYDSYKG